MGGISNKTIEKIFAEKTNDIKMLVYEKIRRKKMDWLILRSIYYN